MEQNPAHPGEAPELSVKAARRRSLRCACVEDPGSTPSRRGSDSPSGTAAWGSTRRESCEHSTQRILRMAAQVRCVGRGCTSLSGLHFQVREEDTPDGLVPDPQATRQVQLLQAPAVLGHLLHRLVSDVGVDSQRQRPQLRTLLGQVADGVVFELAAGGEVDGLQPPAVVGEAAQGQAVHPLAVSQTEALEVHAAQGHRHQGVAGEPDTPAHVHSLQVLVLADDRQQLFVRHPV